MVIHSALPDPLATAIDEVVGGAHVAHGDHDVMAAAGDPDAGALIGPFRSRDVAHAVEATAPAGVPLIAPVATWAGVTRHDEPGCEDDPANHRGTVLRMVARDTEVAARIAAQVRAEGKRALVIAGEHEYGVQLDGQLRLAGLPRAEADADLVVLCGLVGHPEIERARAAGLPMLAFDGVQGADLGELSIALPFAPLGDLPFDHMVYGAERARRGAQLVIETGGDLRAMRASGRFDEHGDPIDPPVWFWRARLDAAAGPPAVGSADGLGIADGPVTADRVVRARAAVDRAGLRLGAGDDEHPAARRRRRGAGEDVSPFRVFIGARPLAKAA